MEIEVVDKLMDIEGIESKWFPTDQCCPDPHRMTYHVVQIEEFVNRDGKWFMVIDDEEYVKDGGCLECLETYLHRETDLCPPSKAMLKAREPLEFDPIEAIESGGFEDPEGLKTLWNSL